MRCSQTWVIQSLGVHVQEEHDDVLRTVNPLSSKVLERDVWLVKIPGTRPDRCRRVPVFEDMNGEAQIFLAQDRQRYGSVGPDCSVQDVFNCLFRLIEVSFTSKRLNVCGIIVAQNDDCRFAWISLLPINLRTVILFSGLETGTIVCLSSLFVTSRPYELTNLARRRVAPMKDSGQAQTRRGRLDLISV